MDTKRTHEVGLKSESPGGDYFVLTRKSGVGPFSFADPTKYKYDEKAPPPIYMRLDDLNRPQKFDPATLLRDFEVMPNGELKVKDAEIIERQKGVISEIIKSFASKMLEGKSIVGLSLPVRIFEPRTQMERIADLFHFVPHFCRKAAESENPIVRLQNVLAMLISPLMHTTSQRKPFNPLLGETYQGRLDKDTEIFMEHLSHHPPISRYLITNPLFRVYGSLTYNAQISPTKLIAYNEGWSTVEFNDKRQIKFSHPAAHLSGLLVGQRSVRPCHTATAFDEQTQQKGVILVGEKQKGSFLGGLFKGKKYDILHGEIYRYNPEEHAKLLKLDWALMNKSMENFSDRVVTTAQIKGNYFQNLFIDEEEVWNITRDLPYSKQQFYSEDPLPSDSRFREDLIWLAYGNEKYAQEWKLRLEEQQRHDRKLRMKEKMK